MAPIILFIASVVAMYICHKWARATGYKTFAEEVEEHLSNYLNNVELEDANKIIESVDEKLRQDIQKAYNEFMGVNSDVSVEPIKVDDLFRSCESLQNIEFPEGMFMVGGDLTRVLQ